MKTVYEPGFEHGPWVVGDPERYSWVAANCFSEMVSSEPVQCKPRRSAGCHRRNPGALPRVVGVPQPEHDGNQGFDSRWTPCIDNNF